ncbi:DUF4267 domain-containing protein [Chitinophaga flava]|uniref:DUF4267 domain-containing protein n=1 Tax=Chitinophaga flava TaxID=2259036 RepID=A0A365XX06_9BACT|nr:DUF4267 domain-containing protein [Chitinophaga flava]RBL90115.1 hypothetical protein DF182_26985 [Chitinophaga flava]
MKTISQKTAYIASLATGLLLIFIGVRFFLAPLHAEADYGIQTGLSSNFAFCYIKGIRDMATGILTLVLLLNKEFRSLGWLMLCMGIVPVTDFLIVLNSAYHQSSHLYPHLTAVLICLTVGPYYLYTTKNSTMQKVTPAQ